VKPLYDAAPDFIRDNKLVHFMRDKLSKSYIHLIEVYENKTKKNHSTTKELLLLATNSHSNHLSGFLFSLHHELLDAMRSGNPQMIEKILNTLYHVCSTYKNTDINIINYRDNAYGAFSNDCMANAVKFSFDKTYETDFGLMTSSDDSFVHTKDTTEQSLNFLKDFDQEIYKEMQELVSDIVICKSKTLNAATSYITYGFVYLRELREGENWTRILEHIVHEAAHHHLHAITMHDPLFEKTKQLYKSPLRIALRPMIGIYHAMFVLARTLRVFNKLKKDGQYQELISQVKTSYNEQENEEDFIVKFEDAYTIIKQNAKLTEIGNKLLESCKEMAYN
jgi:hypothetical protein